MTEGGVRPETSSGEQARPGGPSIPEPGGGFTRGHLPSAPQAGTATRRPGVLSDELREVARRIIAKYPNPRSATLPLLFLVQSVEGYVSDAGMREVAELLDLTPAQVLASCSFYTMLKRGPQGRYLISVCRNITCAHRGGRALISAFEDKLGIEVGETTPDGTFTLEAAECLATCDGAPSLQVNYEDFYRVSPTDAERIVDALRGGETVTSVRGDPVRTHEEVSFETATAGVRGRAEGDEQPVGGEAPPQEMLPGSRPQVHSDDETTVAGPDRGEEIPPTSQGEPTDDRETYG